MKTAVLPSLTGRGRRATGSRPTGRAFRRGGCASRARRSSVAEAHRQRVQLVGRLRRRGPAPRGARGRDRRDAGRSGCRAGRLVAAAGAGGVGARGGDGGRRRLDLRGRGRLERVLAGAEHAAARWPRPCRVGERDDRRPLRRPARCSARRASGAGAAGSGSFASRNGHGDERGDQQQRHRPETALDEPARRSRGASSDGSGRGRGGRRDRGVAGGGRGRRGRVAAGPCAVAPAVRPCARAAGTRWRRSAPDVREAGRSTCRSSVSSRSRRPVTFSFSLRSARSAPGGRRSATG